MKPILSSQILTLIQIILSDKVSKERISCRETLSYAAILLDDNVRQTLCRLHFNTRRKYVEFFHEGKSPGQKKQLLSVSDISLYSMELGVTLDRFLAL